jgi:Zinc knuckle
MVRPSNSDRSPEARIPEPDTVSVSEAEPERRTGRPRHSLAHEEPEFDFEYLKNAFAQDPQKLYQQIKEALYNRDDTQEQNATLQAEAIAQQEEALAQRQEMAELMIQNEQLQSELLQALRQNRQASPEIGSSRKTTKLPDPPVFTDGTDININNWLSRMRKKLRSNKDHFPTEDMKLAYAEGRIGGQAATHAEERFKEDATEPYETVEDLFEHLHMIYTDPNRLFTAKNEFKKLYMKKDQTFHDFYTKFLQLAGEAKIAITDQKYELYTKLSFGLQKAVITNYNSEGTVQEFAKQCTVFDQSLKAIEEREGRTTGRQKSNKNGTTSREPTETSQTPNVSKNNSNNKEIPKYGSELRQQLSKAGKCFICQESGHLMRDCPKRQVEVKVVDDNESGKEAP